MRILVTGGAGFIGSHIVDRLLEQGHDVRVADNFSTGRRENLPPPGEVEVVEVDLGADGAVRAAMLGCDAILHQAALPSVPRSIADPVASFRSNVTGTLNMLTAARDAGVRRVVLASSSSVYGANGALPKAEALRPMPISPYAEHKLAAEEHGRAFHERYGLETVCLRYFNVFGPRQDPSSRYAAAIPRFIDAFLSGERPTIYGDGEQSRDFNYVANVVDANLLALRAEGVAGAVLNVGSGERQSVNVLVERLRALVGSDLEAMHLDARPGDVRHSVADTSRARASIGYEPIVSFEDGLRATLAHVRDAKALA